MSSDSNSPRSGSTNDTSNPPEPSVNDERNSDRRSTRSQQDTSIVDSVRSTFYGFNRDQQIVVVGSVVTIIGAFLPWATILGTTILGVSNGDGIITIILALIATGVIYWTPLSNELQNLYVAAGAGVLTILVGLYSLTGFSGTGIYVTILGGIIMAYPGVSTALSNYQRG